MEVGEKKEEGGRVVSVNLVYEGGSGDQFAAWLGPYGLLEFAPITEAEGGKKTAAVPKGWYGDVWVVVVSKSGIALAELADHMVAGPVMVWISEP